jgi:hypothetical protein
MMPRIGNGWLEIVLLASLFTTDVFRPERISRPLRFRLACIVLAISFALPQVFALVVSLTSAGGAVAPAADMVSNEVQRVMLIAGPLLFALSFWMAISSLIPDHRRA